MKRVALATLAAIVMAFPVPREAHAQDQDASYKAKREELVKQLEGSQKSLNGLQGERLQLAARIESVLAQLTAERAKALTLSSEQSALRQLDSLLTGAQDNLDSQRDRLTALGDAVRRRTGAVMVVLFRADSSTTQPVQSAALMIDGANTATRSYTGSANGALNVGAVDEVFRGSVLPTAHSVSLAVTTNGQPLTQTVNVTAAGESVTYVQFALRNGQLVQTTWTSRGTTPF